MSKGSNLVAVPLRRFVAIIAFACVTAALFCNLVYSQDDELSRDEAAVVKARVQKIRGLKLKRDVPVTYLSVAETEARFTAQFAKQVSQEEIDTGVEENKMIGLFPPDLKIERKDLADMTLELAGFYDDHHKDIVIIDRPLTVELPERYRNALTEMRKLDTMGTLGHELTHALQDQYFNIEAALKSYKGNSDRELAYKAIVEGDATLSGFSVVTGRVDDETIDYFDSHLQDIVPVFMGRMEGKPRAMTYPFIFQYTEGARFVAEAYHRGKWASVNALFNGPPLSTQQIMHPELYFDRPTPALTVKLAGYEKVLHDWKKVDEDTLGELMLKIMLERTMGEDTPYVEASTKWAGDRIVALQKGKSLTILWMITFRSAGDADNFAQLYSGILEKVLPGTTARKVDRLGPVVFAMIGDGAIRYREYLPEVWKQSTIDGTPIESYQSPVSRQQAQPRQTSLQPQAAPTPATQAPRTIQAD
ncbi:hypothetical protein [Candidatus Binatus sp.]|uniref:hypothetical protein n=2 Tax=Candidatus Binatus sp. TaxID=2811406 RepID=UPI003BAEF018